MSAHIIDVSKLRDYIENQRAHREGTNKEQVLNNTNPHSEKENRKQGQTRHRESNRTHSTVFAFQWSLENSKALKSSPPGHVLKT